VMVVILTLFLTVVDLGIIQAMWMLIGGSA
jgi:hypothetical protein